ncbi:SDR family NAD(P)-dependent oxidoreductase [Rhodococcus opacus]|uniref:SDR family NAD(P)-dependent oxidoreductase n=2 Tax=Rhodococcus opacus TaxID=37919 RepID=A0AAX3YDV9_RHOOP|nr:MULTISPECIES: SDR family NAD(P)-dependent oxidoreductase [Rhodococcus]ELB94651.1 short chain dehydrogenase [Rhodococcus wratislaviensis IFP 2016]NHU43761.1 SDR family NAD(P)-dependent oxidoreductase [Rhodococcus sp. A14]EKT77828.1 short chain dehydrogenase [Rhodococcus opacus M213]MBA8960978.1 NAD(P)-dependent dehydrogenase (short-subunit alcohol dehydrogenase family) [Rhodococcus opacus]MBP2203156.1 NAD(P)-dependent dehydrogenase (short-subunit alcohol dehydrogenase family) [Rhodococcus op
MSLLGEVRGWRSGTRKHHRLRDLDGTLVVVTGGGSGIGRETALAFASEGAVVVVADRDLESAQLTSDLINSAQMKGGGAVAIFGGGSHAYQVDVAVEDEVQRFAEKVQAEHGTPDIVVNNAGIGYSGTFTKTPQKDFERVMDVNFWGVVYGSRAFSQQMIDRGTGGHIVNLSSAAAFTPQKRLTAYATSKAAVFMLSDCLRAELVNHGIGVSAICPGLVHTNIVKATDFAGATPEEQTKMRDRADKLYRRRGFTPDRVATQIVRAVKHNKAVVPVTPEAKFGRALSRLAPGSMRLGARFDLG